MANASSIRAGKAFVELFADNSRLVKGLRAAANHVKAFGAKVRNIGLGLSAAMAPVTAGIVASLKHFSSYGDQVAKMAKRTGLSVGVLSELQFVASQTGTEFASLEMGFRRMQRSIYDAGRGMSTAVDALSDLGLSFKNLDGLSPEAQFKLLADRIGKVADPTKRAAIAMTLFGRTGTNLLPMFAQGAAGIEALQKQARDLGLTMSSVDAKAAEDFTDAMDALWKTVKMAVFQLGASLAPALQAMAERLAVAVKAVRDWIDTNRGLVVSAAKIVAILAGVGMGLTVLGTTIQLAGSAMLVFVGTLNKMLAVMGLVKTALLALTSPVGLVVGAVGALGAYLLHTSGQGGAAIAWLGEKFNVLKDDALGAYRGIADAMATGDISQAVKILWLTIKLEWTRGVNVLKTAWLTFKNFFVKIAANAWDAARATWEVVTDAIEKGWIETTAFFARAWQGFTGFFAKTWENIKAAAKKAWNWIKSLFDDSINLEAENKLVDQQREKAIAGIENDKQRRLAQRELERQRAWEKASREHQAAMARIGQDNLDAHAGLDEQYARQMAEDQKSLEKARAEWREAINQARQNRQTKDAAGAGEGEFSTPAAPAAPPLPDMSDVLGQIKTAVTGTFNAAAIGGLGMGTTAERTAKATEQSVRHLKRIDDNTRSNGATFT